MKNNVCKLLYCVCAVLVLAFIVFLGIDFYYYHPIHSSAPFYAYIIVRGLEFLLPAVIIFIISEVIRRKFK